MHISPSAASGPDGVPSLLLRNCADELKIPLTLLWRASLNEGRLPSALKLSRVAPVHKGGDRCEPGNYRPISLTSHISKIFERIVVAKLINYLNECSLFNRNQHGFRSGRSCLSQLLEHHQRILANLEAGIDTDVVYLDFAKAFDKVDYGVLIGKLRSMGISGRLLRWLSSFLNDRKQMVSVQGHLSTKDDVISGVPQGSSLGPILFLIHIADIDEELQYASVSSFADDTRLSVGIAGESDQVKMQDDLNKAYLWAEQNNMRFNGKKFELVRYSLGHNERVGSYLTPEGLNIELTQVVSDLGIAMQNTATFDIQIDNMCQKSKQQAGWVLRTFATREAKPLLVLYKALVLPHLEYCCQLWSPMGQGKIRKLEDVQRNYTSKITGVSNMNYWERLEALSLYSLQRRRERYLILYTYKILSGAVPNFQNEKFRIELRENQRRGTFCRIPPLRNQSTCRVKTLVDSSFAIHGPRLFNSLPKDIRNYNGSVEGFKGRLDKYLKSVPDKPFLPSYPQQTVQSNSLIHQLAVVSENNSIASRAAVPSSSTRSISDLNE